MSEDRFRKYMRVPLPLVVEIKFEGEKDFQPYLLVDISWGGMYVRMDSPQPIGTRFVAQLQAPERKKNLEISGKVVTQNKETDGRVHPGVGLTFDSIDQNTKSLLQKLIDRMLNPRGV
jgi:uncharacterized protein (TIGR02266 family)